MDILQSTKLYIDLVIERGDKLEDIEQKSRELEEQASIFDKNARKTRRQLIVYINDHYSISSFHD